MLLWEGHQSSVQLACYLHSLNRYKICTPVSRRANQSDLLKDTTRAHTSSKSRLRDHESESGALGLLLSYACLIFKWRLMYPPAYRPTSQIHSPSVQHLGNYPGRRVCHTIMKYDVNLYVLHSIAGSINLISRRVMCSLTNKPINWPQYTMWFSPLQAASFKITTELVFPIAEVSVSP